MHLNPQEFADYCFDALDELAECALAYQSTSDTVTIVIRPSSIPEAAQLYGKGGGNIAAAEQFLRIIARRNGYMLRLSVDTAHLPGWRQKP